MGGEEATVFVAYGDAMREIDDLRYCCVATTWYGTIQRNAALPPHLPALSARLSCGPSSHLPPLSFVGGPGYVWVLGLGAAGVGTARSRLG